MRMRWMVGPALLWSATAVAEVPEYTLTLREHRFEPAELTVPANTKVRLKVINSDSTPEEFESHELNREKLTAGGATATIFVGPLEAGRYPFFGEFNEASAQGVLVVE